MGTDGGGLVRMRDGQFSHFNKTNGLAGDKVRVIYEGRDESLWVGTTMGMTHMKGVENGNLMSGASQSGFARNSQFSTITYKVRDGLLAEAVSHLRKIATAIFGSRPERAEPLAG